MALAKGHSKIRCGPLSDHTKTAIYVAELLTKVSLIIVIICACVIFFNFERQNLQLQKYHRQNPVEVNRILPYHKQHLIHQIVHLSLNVKD
jgi:ABC-type uncharacterized transport system permease subunit